MSFKSEVLDVLKTLPQWQDIVAPAVEHADYTFRKNANRCFEINPAIARRLNKHPDIEALVVGAHYPKDNPSCSNYFVLARRRSTGETLLVDGVINSIVPDMHKPFIGTLDEARQFQKTNIGHKWDALWNLDHMVVHEPQVNVEDRGEFRKNWGEFGGALEFNPPREMPRPKPQNPFTPYKPFSNDQVNDWLARTGGVALNVSGPNRK